MTPRDHIITQDEARAFASYHASRDELAWLKRVDIDRLRSWMTWDMPRSQWSWEALRKELAK
jgi:hypothetical protein